MPSAVTLPPERPFTLRSQLGDGWSDNYGAVHLAARHAGLDLSGHPYFLRGVWQHGVFGPWQEHAPETLAYCSPHYAKWPLFVAREEQAAVLRAAGASDVTAIGMPFAYVPPSGLPRAPGSLLVVPTHTLAGATFEDRTPFRNYAAYVKSLAPRFSRIVVCVHPSCQKNGLWINEFAALGIETVIGATVNDLHSLARMRALFDQFEFVTTNGWGSHIAYALACGARVSIQGDAIEESPETYRNWLRQDLTWSSRPDLLAAIHNPEVFRRRREFLDRLYVAPHLAPADVAWGEWWIGTGHKLSPEAMRATLARWIDADWPSVPGAAGLALGRRRRLFICHEATRTGAPINLLHFMRWLRVETDTGFDILIGKDGSLKDELVKIAPVYDTASLPALRPRLPHYSLVYANTVCCSRLISHLGAPLPPVVTHVHELECSYNVMGPVLMTTTLAQSRRILACGEQVADRLKTRFGLDPATVDVTPETCDPVAARKLAAEPPRPGLPAWPADACVFIACGTCDVRKGADLFVQVAARVRARWTSPRPLRFAWIGVREDTIITRHIRDDVRKLGLEDCLDWIPCLDNPFPLLARAHAFCLTSREDPYPLVMLEAGALGVPTVAFRDAGGGEDFCDRGAGFAVPYLEAPAMADQLLALAADPAARDAAGLRARALVETRHSVASVAPALHALLRDYESRPWPAPSGIDQICARIAPGQPIDWRFYIDARRATAAAIDQARKLAARGDRAAAANTLVGTASRSLSSNEPVLLVSNLVTLGDALSAIEPAQGKYLLGEAEKIAAARGLSCDDFRDPVWLASP
ncbi:MAG: glycosyltransferase [Opitutaceae bacterium]|nr:glycosyltransferase [Opitutaceae bacterium]